LETGPRRDVQSARVAGEDRHVLGNRSSTEQSLALAREWKRLGRAATAIALLTSPVLFLALLVSADWAWYWALLAALAMVVIFRGAVDVLAHKVIPSPTVYGVESELRHDDVINRRRLWYWRRKFRRAAWLFFFFALAVGIGMFVRSLQGGDHSPAVSLVEDHEERRAGQERDECRCTRQLSPLRGERVALLLPPRALPSLGRLRMSFHLPSGYPLRQFCLHAWQAESAAEAAQATTGCGVHLRGREFLRRADRFVHRGQDHVLQHVDVLGVNGLWIDLDLLQLEVAAHLHGDHSAADRRGDGLVLELVLGLGHLGLHLLGLLEDGSEVGLLGH